VSQWYIYMCTKWLDSFCGSGPSCEPMIYIYVYKMTWLFLWVRPVMWANDIYICVQNDFHSCTYDCFICIYNHYIQLLHVYIIYMIYMYMWTQWLSSIYTIASYVYTITLYNCFIYNYIQLLNMYIQLLI